MSQVNKLLVWHYAFHKQRVGFATACYYSGCGIYITWLIVDGDFCWGGAFDHRLTDLSEVKVQILEFNIKVGKLMYHKIFQLHCQRYTPQNYRVSLHAFSSNGRNCPIITNCMNTREILKIFIHTRLLLLLQRRLVLNLASFTAFKNWGNRGSIFINN